MTANRFPMPMTRTQRASSALLFGSRNKLRNERTCIWNAKEGRLHRRVWRSKHLTPAARCARLLWRLVSTARWS